MIANSTAMMVLQIMAGQPSLPTAMKKNTTEIRPEADRIACSMSSPCGVYWRGASIAASATAMQLC